MLSLEKLLRDTSGNGLEKLVQRAQNMELLAQKLKAGLDNDLAEQILAVNVRDDTELVVVCASSAWAARLRFESDQLIDAARGAGMDVTRCRVKVGGQHPSADEQAPDQA